LESRYISYIRKREKGASAPFFNQTYFTKEKNINSMNIQEADILQLLYYKPYTNQRILSETSGYSIGVVNRSLKNLTMDGYLDDSVRLTKKAREELKKEAPRNAIILAAGPGMRMVPIDRSAPKALLEVKGERLIDRIIGQLHEVGIRDITVVAGFMMESLEHLIDEYGVKIAVNPDYLETGNLHSLALVADLINNTYIIPCDIWCRRNPFRTTELYSWYMVTDRNVEGTGVRVNRKMEPVRIPEKAAGNPAIGISYLREPEAETVRKRLTAMDRTDRSGDFWEAALYSKDRMIVKARVVQGSDAVEINTYEQLRDLDSDSDYLKSEVIKTIASVLQCSESDVVNITVLKKGMTNRSFLFRVRGGRYAGKYSMRIPGEGTDRLIIRKQEVEVYHAISGLGFCDDPMYIDPETGYKITKYLADARTCDPEKEEDLIRCMDKLRALHNRKLVVDHAFDLFGQIEFYESLREGMPSVYGDYPKTKEQVMSLKPFIDGLEKDWCLTHIDAVPDNFLFYMSGEEEQLQLTDWEYSGMQDPHVDIAMFCVYSLYDKRQCDHLIDLYFEGSCDRITRAKIYAYISICGLLWSDWCEYKRRLGVEFGEYSLRQYRYAKEYYRYAKELIGET